MNEQDVNGRRKCNILTNSVRHTVITVFTKERAFRVFEMLCGNYKQYKLILKHIVDGSMLQPYMIKEFDFYQVSY